MSAELEALRKRPKSRIGTPRIPCVCGRPTEVQMQVALREKGQGAKSLGSRSISLCVRCALKRQAEAVRRSV